MGREPNARSKPCSLAEGIAPNSRVRASASARPSQSRDSSPLMFSKRRIAIRAGPVGSGCRAQPARMRINNSPLAAALQYTRIQREQLFELRQFADGGERRIFAEFLAFLIPFLDGLAQILERKIVAAALH